MQVFHNYLATEKIMFPPAKSDIIKEKLQPAADEAIAIKNRPCTLKFLQTKITHFLPPTTFNQIYTILVLY